MRLFIATTNRDKLREIGGLLATSDVELLSLAGLPPVEEPEETGATFEENALIKAVFYDGHVHRSTPEAGQPRLLTVAEDSGLVIDALGGEPGIYSARFVSSDASYAERFAEIYRRLQSGGAPRPWTARFVCAVAVVEHGVPVFATRGTVEGQIADTPHGTAGFGYDPIFFFPSYGTTLAAVSEPRKLAVAHRGQAFRALARWLSERHPY